MSSPAYSHVYTAGAEVLDRGQVIAELPVSSGSVTLSSTAANRATVDLTIVGEDYAVTDPDSLLAPYGNEIRVWRGDPDPVQLGIFRIDRASVRDVGGALEIGVSGPDRSGRIADEPFTTAFDVDRGEQGVDVITEVLQQVDTGFVFDFAEGSFELPKLIASEGDDRWAFCQAIAYAMGGELYFDREGVCVLRPVPEGLNPVAEFSEGEGGVLLGVERDWDRATIYNRIVVTGDNPDSDEDEPYGEAVDTVEGSPTRYGGEFGRKTLRVSNVFIQNDVEAGRLAEGLLARMTGAPDVVRFTTLVDPSRDVGEAVQIKRERLGLNELHVIDSLSIPLDPAGQMSGETRLAKSEFL